MSEILWLVGILAPKGLSHDFSYPSDAYAYVVVIRGRDDVVRGNCARAGFAWRSARQSLKKGGYVLVMRHASSPREMPDKQAANPDHSNRAALNSENHDCWVFSGT